MGGTQVNPRGHAMGMCLAPTVGAKAPAVTGLESWKPELGTRSRQVVTTKSREFKKLLRYLDTDRVRAQIVFSRITAAIAIKAGYWCLAATLELFAENVFRLFDFHSYKISENIRKYQGQVLH